MNILAGWCNWLWVVRFKNTSSSWELFTRVRRSRETVGTDWRTEWDVQIEKRFENSRVQTNSETSSSKSSAHSYYTFWSLDTLFCNSLFVSLIHNIAFIVSTELVCVTYSIQPLESIAELSQKASLEIPLTQINVESGHKRLHVVVHVIWLMCKVCKVVSNMIELFTTLAY